MNNDARRKLETGSASLDRDWLTVVASAVCLIFSVGTITLYSFGVFFRPLGLSFHWTRGQISEGVAIGQYSFAAASLLWGWLIDRYGPRRTILPAILGLTVGLISLAFLGPHLWELYAAFAIIPFLAGAASPLGYAAVLIRTFERRLGLALGLSLMGVGLGATLLPVLAQSLVTHFGWQHAFGALGVLTLAITLPAAVLATRNAKGRNPRRNHEVSGRLARGSRRAFLQMCCIFLLVGIASVGALAHLIPMMIDRGFSPSGAARVAALTGLATIVSRGGIGTLMDRFFAPYVLMGASFVGAAGCTLLALTHTGAASLLAALMLGLLVGAEVDFIAFFVRSYFPPAAFGRIYGIVFALFIAGSGTGPLLLGRAFDQSHSYHSGLITYAVVAVLAGSLAGAMPHYERARAIVR